MGVLTGKAVIVTGAGRGIGRAIAMLAAEEGAGVVVADYGVAINGEDPSSEVADGVVAEITRAGGKAIASAESVTSLEGTRRMAQACVDAFGTVDGAVGCAGILRHGPFADMTEHDFSFVVDTHLKGQFNLFRAVIERPEGGDHASMVAISSGYLSGDPIRLAYRSAKAGVVALMKSVALAGEGRYRCNCIAPVANTRMTVDSKLVMDGDPEDVAPMAVYLLSDQSKDVTGRIFSVHGSYVSSWKDPVEDRMVRTSGRWTQDDLAAQVPWLHSQGGGAILSGDPVAGFLEKHGLDH